VNRAQVIKNLRADVARVETAKGNREALSALYVEFIGYCPFEDDPSTSEEFVFDVLQDYPKEVADSLGIHWSEVQS
jgi:hypothetical protein